MEGESTGKVSEDYSEYLMDGESVKNSYKIGLYTALTTGERLVFLKKIPKAIIGVEYDKITSVEHRTRILYNEAVSAIIFLALSYYVYSYDKTRDLATPLKAMMENYLPELSGILSPQIIIQGSVLLCAAVGLKHLFSFLPSLVGFLRIGRLNHAPIVIRSWQTPVIRQLIREIESSKIKSGREAKAPAYMPAPTVAATAPEKKLDVSETLKREFEGMAANSIAVINIESHHHMDTVSGLLDILVNKKRMGGVYISVTRPYDYILEALDKAKVKSNDIYFIDCISQMAGKVPTTTDKNIVFVENPSSLEEVSMYLDRLLARVGSHNKFMLLDSVSSLMIYNTEKSVKEFTHFIMNKMRLESLGGVVLSIEKKEAEELVQTLVPMADKEIRL
ncbi:MAG TPA: hypothetical protein ENN13_03355 [Candidatus Altiarchaeales archaeon]|nr:hypothetical protein [Candidatus Altiarchaeales archaeon]